MKIIRQDNFNDQTPERLVAIVLDGDEACHIVRLMNRSSQRKDGDVFVAVADDYELKTVELKFA